MSHTLKIAAAIVLSLIIVVGAVVMWRTLRRGDDKLDGIAMLTPVRGAVGFEPANMPRHPVLHAGTDARTLNVAFGYEVGSKPYALALTMSFPPGAEQGRAIVGVRYQGHDGSTESDAVRRWDAPRSAYAVALADKFMMSPAVPSLCIKAVIGPELARWDLAGGSICVAQRDTGGNCHPETLACGLLRP